MQITRCSFGLFAALCGAVSLVGVSDQAIAQSGSDAQTNSLFVKAPQGAAKLQDALKRLASNARDLSALIDAGDAALQMGDPVAALGFFARADAIAPRNAKVKAGLGSALLGNENPFEALNMFNQAAELGIGRDAIALDRGLAYDLVGKQDFAQQDYRFLLASNGNNPEAIRRFALSLGIVGKRKEAESLLTSLLYANDRAAWRIRAFVLAINKDFDGALAITRGSLPPSSASAIEPFFRYMPKLTPSQQAAAAHFGHFPQEANIGRDNPRVGEYAALDPSRTRDQILTSGADAGLIPAGEPLGTNNKQKPLPKASRQPRRRPGRKERDPAKINEIVNGDTPPRAIASAPATETPGAKEISPGFTALADKGDDTIDLAKADTKAALPKAVSKPAPQPVAQSAPEPVIQPTSQAAILPAPKAVTPAATVPTPKIIEQNPVPVVLAATPAPAAAPAPKPAAEAEPKSFAELMRGIDVPVDERARNSDAVDITAITPAKPKPKPKPAPKAEPKAEPKPKEPPKPKHPSRHWVQVSGGADTNALKTEWRRMIRKAPDVFKGMNGWTTPLNKTNRVLTGPFDSKAAAQDFVNKLAKEDISAFTFTSDEGQVIDKLD